MFYLTPVRDHISVLKPSRLHTSTQSAAKLLHPFRSHTCASRGHASSSYTRVYAYEVDTHGQLFLTGTKHRNFTSCYKDPLFLDVLLGKLRPNMTSEKYSASENSQRTRYLMDGYRWVSRCGPELNFLKADCTPVVYQNLVRHNQHELSYAGTLTTPFKPELLRVDITTGYVFHQSPGGRARYGNFSLLRSSLVLNHLGSHLTLVEEARDGEPVGWLDWQGRKWPIERLQSTDLDWQ